MRMGGENIFEIIAYIIMIIGGGYFLVHMIIYIITNCF